MSRNFNPLLLLSAIVFPLASCTSTEILDSDTQNQGSLVSLTIAAPGVYNFGSATRADDQHQLRLVARLYSTSAPTTVIQTKEDVANSSETTIQFSIENTGKYFVTVFADYIDKNVSPDDKGHYPDKYYNTTEPGKVTTITNSTAEGTTSLTDFFNNDNRDCFAGKTVFEKGLNVVSQDLKLKRPVCKVQVAAPNNKVATLVESLTITECSHLDSFSFALDESDKTGTLTPTAEGTAITATPLTLSNENAKITSLTDDSLFFFYTFGGEANDDNRPALGNLTFELVSLNDIELDNDTRTIAQGLIKPAPNYRVTIKGGINWISAKPSGDDITVIFEGLQDWDNNPSNITYP